MVSIVMLFDLEGQDKGKIYGQITWFLKPTLSSFADLFSRKSDVISPYELDAQIPFLISKGFADFAMLDYSMHVTLFSCKLHCVL